MFDNNNPSCIIYKLYSGGASVVNPCLLVSLTLALLGDYNFGLPGRGQFRELVRTGQSAGRQVLPRGDG